MHINDYVYCSMHIFLKHVLVHVIKNNPEYIFRFPIIYDILTELKILKNF